jgi:FKBP-type peptidyl-prolyl cis-trans isomerase 2
MHRAKIGDTVNVHYMGSLEDGTVLDTSQDREPVKLTLGSGDYIPGFEKEIVGMAIGEQKSFIVSPEEAFGLRHKELMACMKRSDLPENVPHIVGQELTLKVPAGQPIQAIISRIDGETIILDANHPLAGRTLVFSAQLVGIVGA